MANLNITAKLQDEASAGADKIADSVGGIEKQASIANTGFMSLRTVGVATLAAVGVAAVSLAAGFGMAMKTAINMNSTLETSTLQFATLMGDAGRAEEHVRSLFEFAKNTPFETGPIIEASRMMQTFGGDILNTTENLSLIGDASAATSAPIDELGFWVGRLYSNLQAGKPFGEAAMRLQELAVMSPKARAEMERLQAAGASADEIFAVMQEDLGKFSGAMEAQAGTWTGLMSTIKDSLAITAAGALKPFFDLAKEGLATVAAFLSSPELTAGVEMFAAQLTKLGTVAKLFIGHIQSGMPFLESLQVLITQLALTFGMTGPEARAFGESFGAIALKAQEFINAVSALIEPIITAVSQFVSWKDVLIALGIAVASVVLPLIYSLIAALFPVIAVFALVVGAVALLRNAWETDFMGIRTALITFWEVTAKPALEQLQQWLAVNLPVAIETLKAIWAAVWPVMQTALSAYWDFTKAVWTALWNFLTTILIPAIVALWNYWVNVAWPAISAALMNAWAIMQPILIAVWDYIVNTIIPTVQELWNKWVNVWWPAISTALTNAWTIIKGVWTELGRWINDNIVPWIEFLHKKWVLEIWPAIQKAVEAAWAILKPIWEKFREYLEDVLPPALEGMRKVFETVMGAIDDAVRPVHEMWKNFVDAVSNFWNWLTSHKFEFDISIPDLPDWATPGSPLPIHTAWKDFAADMSRMSITPTMDVSGMTGGFPSGSGDSAPAEKRLSFTLINPQFYGVQDADSLLAQLEGLAA